MAGLGIRCLCGARLRPASIAVCLLVSGAGCGAESTDRAVAPGDVGPDTLLLEFGGEDNPILRDRLVAAGVDVPNRPQLSSAGGHQAEAPGPEEVLGSAAGVGTEEPESDPDSRSEADPELEPLRDRVQLQEGDTLSDLCRRELGQASLWRRIAEHNKWSDRDLRRLPAGTWVSIPADLQGR